MQRGQFFVAIETSLDRKTNIGPTLRCAVGLGCTAVIVVGNISYGTHGAHGSQRHIQVIHFYTWDEVREYALSRSCALYGVVSPLQATESTISAISVDEITFSANAVFMIGNRQSVLSATQIRVADSLIYVNFPGGSRLGSLVTADLQLSICLHQFAVSNGYEQVIIEEEKYCVPEKKVGKKAISESKVKGEMMSCDLYVDSESWTVRMFQGCGDDY